MATILIDLDMFKDINNLGHVAGDTLLKQVTGRLKKILIRGELLARMGKTNFFICLIAPYSRNEVFERIKNIQDLMKEPFLVQETLKEITISIGVSFYPEDGKDLNTLIKHADMAMYEVKHSGRNNVIFFSSQVEEKKLEQINMLQSLKIALKQEQFILHFQPKHSTNHKKKVGVETLVRWNHPEKGFVSPDEFISLAEENGLIIPLSNWIIE
ncbi:putative signaling protein [Bacillus sp. T2.9-1]|nr:putative signaling protein [Bacillus sp. T2.9-1]